MLASAAIFAVIYSIYIVIDTQKILGGKNKELMLDDYVLGATILYVDIISLFLKLLRLLGKKKSDWSSSAIYVKLNLFLMNVK